MFRFCLRTLSVLLLIAGAARADDFYSYAYSGTGISGSGTVGLTPGGSDGVFLVTYIDGQVNNMTINGLLQPGVYKSNDNLFYQGDSYLDASGVSFDLNDGAQVNIYYDGSDYYFLGDESFQLDSGTLPMRSFGRFFSLSSSPIDSIKLDSFTFAPQEVPTDTTPEPSSLALLGTGVLATAGMMRRRFTRA